MYNLSDEIILTLSNRGSIISMAYIPLVSPLAPSCDKLERKEARSEFSSKVTLETTKVGMSLPTVLPATKPPQGIKVLKNRAKEPGLKTAFDKEDEPITGPTGFIKKYWYIILAVIFMSISGGTPEEEAKNGPGAAVQGQAGTGTGSAAASSAPAAAAPIAASTPSPGGTKHRRGKRA
jgi:hypothetical protein